MKTTQPWRELRWISCRILHQWCEEKMQKWGNNNSLYLQCILKSCGLVVHSCCHGYIINCNYNMFLHLSTTKLMWRFRGANDLQHSNISGLQVFVLQEPGKDNTEAAYITERNQPWSAGERFLLRDGTDAQGHRNDRILIFSTDSNIQCVQRRQCLVMEPFIRVQNY